MAEDFAQVLGQKRKAAEEVAKGLADLRAEIEKRTNKPAENNIEIECNGDFNWEAFLQHVQKTGAVGHSFSIVVDPGDSDHEKSFGFDGDGADRILSAKINGKNILKG